MGRVDLAGKAAVLFRSSEVALFSASPTRDGKWLAVIARRPPADHRALAIPFRDGSLASPSEWVSLTDPGN
jgi:hypothetical protein